MAKMTDEIINDFKEVKNFTEWANLIEKWIKKSPKLENNLWFETVVNQYKPTSKRLTRQETEKLVKEALTTI